MEVDWAVEIGPEQPFIDAAWEGFVDLQRAPHDITRLAEAALHPALRSALLTLNAKNSAVFTTKCDAWPLEPSEIDPDEFGAAREDTAVGFAAYIDLLERLPANFASFEFHERRAKEFTFQLRALELRQARVDIVVREAFSAEGRGYGLTLYVAACGATQVGAYQAWEKAIARVAATIASAAQSASRGE